MAAKHIVFNSNLLTPVSRPRVYWTNVPGAREHMSKLKFGSKKKGRATLGEMLDAGRKTGALFSDCILATGQKSRPVKPKGGGPMEPLNPTEVERLMATEGYTENCNLTSTQRLEVLGQSWHLQTIVELMRPLCEHCKH